MPRKYNENDLHHGQALQSQSIRGKTMENSMVNLGYAPPHRVHLQIFLRGVVNGKATPPPYPPPTPHPHPHPLCVAPEGAGVSGRCPDPAARPAEQPAEVWWRAAPWGLLWGPINTGWVFPTHKVDFCRSNPYVAKSLSSSSTTRVNWMVEVAVVI